MIVERHGQYYVLAEKKGKDGKRKGLGGPYRTLKQARERVEEVKAMRGEAR